jgi:hypothetical protein
VPDASVFVENNILRCPDGVPTSIVNLGGRPILPKIDVDSFCVPEVLAASRSFQAGNREFAAAGFGTACNDSDEEESDASVAAVI